MRQMFYQIRQIMFQAVLLFQLFTNFSLFSWRNLELEHTTVTVYWDGGHKERGKGSRIDITSVTMKVDAIIFNCSEKPHFSLTMFREGDCTCAFVLI